MNDTVWIVEMQPDRQGNWHATVGVRLTKENGYAELRDWKERNPYDGFRLVRYRRESGGK